MGESREKQLFEVRLQKLEKIRQANINPYPPVYHRSHTIQEVLSHFETYLEMKKEVVIAGRIKAIREMGKVSFAYLEDELAGIQLYIKRDNVGETLYELWKEIDLGDVIGAKGTLMITRTGEKTLNVMEWTLLAKCLRTLPIAKEVRDEEGNVIQAYNEFTSQEARYRRRYVDLAVHMNVREVFLKRAKIISSIRKFLDHRGFVEVETPILQPLYGGALARPFTTYHNELKQKLYLRIADELYLKRLIVGGLSKVYEIGKDFRNEGVDRFHSPEFTMLEFYWAYADYLDAANLIEELLEFVALEVLGQTKVKYGEEEIDFKGPYRRAKFFDLLQDATGQDLANASESELLNLFQEKNLEVPDNASLAKLYDELFSELVEPNLIQPTIVMDYPVVLSPLAKRHREHPNLVERFELIIGGKELANSFSELNDPFDQRERFELQRQFRELGDLETQPMDEDYLYALECGMPPTAGLGLGIDRLCMWLLNQPTLRDVVLFPALRPEENEPMLRQLKVDYAIRVGEAVREELIEIEYDVKDANDQLFSRLQVGKKLNQRSWSVLDTPPFGLTADAIQRMFQHLEVGTKVVLLLWNRNPTIEETKEIRYLEFKQVMDEDYLFEQIPLTDEQQERLIEELERRDLKICHHIGYGER
ncbi:MAG: lysine--tRNA ligase [bacterium]|nr:lysine--tRNA ligase [bacterium]